MHNHSKFLPPKWRFFLLAKTTVLLAALIWFVTPSNTTAQVTTIKIQPVKEIQLKLQEKEELKIQVKEVPLIAIKEGQTKEAPFIAIKEAQADDEKKTAEFKALYERIREAMLKGDKATFEALFADDYTAISGRGETMTKQQVIDAHIQKPSSDMQMDKVNFDDMKVKVYGDTVVVTYLAEMSWTFKGNKSDQRARITDIWEWKTGKWLSVASHSSTLPK